MSVENVAALGGLIIGGLTLLGAVIKFTASVIARADGSNSQAGVVTRLETQLTQLRADFEQEKRDREDDADRHRDEMERLRREHREEIEQLTRTHRDEIDALQREVRSLMQPPRP